MTGSVLGEITAPQGTWTVRQDGGVADTDWTSVDWNGEPQGAEPSGTSIVLEGRAADSEAALDAAAFQPLTNGAATGLQGRYVDVRATLAPAPDGTSPVLSDVRIQGRPVTVSIGDDSVVEGETAELTISRPAPGNGDVSGFWTTADGSAEHPGDYPETTGSFLIPAGESSTTVTVDTNDDAVDEPLESFSVNLTNVTGAVVEDGEGTVEIVDNDRNGRFTCRASALRAPLVGEPRLGNVPNDPCRDEAHSLATVYRGELLGGASVRASALEARTDQTPDDLASSPPSDGDSARATATVARASVVVAGISLDADAVSSSASARCSDGSVARSGSTSIAKLRLNGAVVDARDPVSIPLGIGTLHLNQVSHEDGEVVARAVHLDLSGTANDVVIGESRAGAVGNPCVV